MLSPPAGRCAQGGEGRKRARGQAAQPKMAPRLEKKTRAGGRRGQRASGAGWSPASLGPAGHTMGRQGLPRTRTRRAEGAGNAGHAPRAALSYLLPHRALSLTSLGQLRQGVRRPPQGGPVRGCGAVLGQAGDDGGEAGGLREGRVESAGVAVFFFFFPFDSVLPPPAFTRLSPNLGVRVCRTDPTHARSACVRACTHIRTQTHTLCTQGALCMSAALPLSSLSHLHRHVFGRVGLVRHCVQGVLQLALGALPVGRVDGHVKRV